MNGLKILAIERYDRTTSNGATTRQHQEDGCQATATPPLQKYEHVGGPSLKNLAKILRNHAILDSEIELLRRVVFNVVIGNADAHAKNFSVVHDASESLIRIAPVYDVISTVSLPERRNSAGVMVSASTTMGQFINGRSSIVDVGVDDLVTEATTWGVRAKTAREVVNEVIKNVVASIDEVEGDENVLKVVRARAQRLLH
jgi:serine/threonine-protein kinase HipA